MLKLLLTSCIAMLPCIALSQKTPGELGKYLFNNLKNGTINKVDSLIPTLEEMKIVAIKLGIDKDSQQYLDAINGYSTELDKFHENISEIYSDTLGNGLRWSETEFQKVIIISDSIKIDNRNPNSASAPATRLSIYFICTSRKFRITIDDAFEVNGSWKLGNNIYLKQLD